MQRFEGPRCLFLEDTCGSTLDAGCSALPAHSFKGLSTSTRFLYEALGYNCHSNSEEQCRRPVLISEC